MKLSFADCFADAHLPLRSLFRRSALPTGSLVGSAGIEKGLAIRWSFLRGRAAAGSRPLVPVIGNEARDAARVTLATFRDSEVVVGPSGSCEVMVKIFYPQLFKGDARELEAMELALKTHEFSSFLVNTLGITDVGAKFQGRVASHDGCYGLRELGVKNELRALLENTTTEILKNR